MTTFPGSPKLTKGAIVGFDIFNPLASVIIFQYNPTQVSRQLEARTAEQGGSPTEALRLAGAPKETITLNEVILDATDQLEQTDGIATSMGVYPQLSALEMLLYPKSAVVIANTVLMAAGSIEVIQPAAPLTLFIWGIKRVLPVRLSGFSITEERFDPNLNPIAAKLSLTLNVLSYNDFSITHPGYYTFLTHQVVKETMATIGSVNNLSAVAGGNISIL
ncbi:MAG: hypothetical protein M9928_20395 [Anaerolineae bacterium]|nr:hypothetical protein [Anaerolineae bacterium]MCO5187133.1 hypothetical protein [Anaerolineae bacterium]MCO5194769.1 hypothetical protein [Anaerolineae bacterium]MCO5207375.1 hypothetical protein [Anaerolineae bacterium]